MDYNLWTHYRLKSDNNIYYVQTRIENTRKTVYHQRFFLIIRFSLLIRFNKTTCNGLKKDLRVWLGMGIGVVVSRT